MKDSSIEQLSSEIRVLKNKLRISEARFYSVVGKSIDGVIIVNTEGKICYLNPRAEEIFGRNIGQLLDEEFGVPVSHNLSMELGIFNPRKGLIDIELRVIATNWQDQDAFLISCRDITEQKQQTKTIETLNDALKKEKETLLRVNKELESFSYTVSHDLQAPLRSITSFSKLLQDVNANSLDKESVEYIEHIVSGGTKMSALINSLLAYSRIGNMEKEKEETNIKEIIEDALYLIEADIQEKEASINLEGHFPNVACYKERVLQIFLNLIGNSLKYISDGQKPDIKIGCKKIGKSHVFYVKDNGIGIKEKYHLKIFEIFSRLHADESDYQGLGVGLTNVKKIVELHGGKICVKSQLGEGTAFYFTLQECGDDLKQKLEDLLVEENGVSQRQSEDTLAKPYQVERTEYKNATEGTLEVPPQRPLLVVDDDHAALEFFKIIAEKYNLKYPVSYVSTGQDAIDYVLGNNTYADRARYPECGGMLLDINMPGVDGFDVLQTIKSDNRYKSFPAIAMFSTSCSPKDKKRATDLGAVAYIEKDIDDHKLMKEIDELMSKI